MTLTSKHVAVVGGSRVDMPVTFVLIVLFQVDQLSAEIHERKKKDKERVDSETQTEEQVWTETGVDICYF